MGVFIKDVEEKTNLTKKNIRYYEEVGLIKPARDSENDYRIYSESDINKLRAIKVLRELGVPIKEIKDLNDGRITLEECMEDRLRKIKQEEEKYKKIKDICKEISSMSNDLQSSEVTKYFEEINTLNKEGFTMRDIKTNKSKKIAGAVLSSIIFSSFFLFISGIITYFQFTEVEKIPWPVYYFILFILLIPVLSIGYNLIIRIQEIKGGEEDEASKY